MAGPTLFRPSDISTGLVGYWKFNNDATDSSTSGYDLTAVNSPTYTATDYWKSGEYSADLEATSNQYFSIAHASCPNLQLTTYCTLSAWVKPESIGVYGGIVTKNQPTGAKRSLVFSLQATGGIVASVSNDGTAGTATAANSSELLVAGKWYHIAATYDGATICVYINGNLSACVAKTGAINNADTPFEIGIQNTDTAFDFDGLIKDAAVWNVALTPLQIKSLAMGVDLSSNAYRPDSVSTAPTAYWKLNEFSGNRADSAGSYTLTDTNTVLSSGGYIEGSSAFLVRANSERLAAANNTVLHPGNEDCSWSAWIKLSALTLTQPIMTIWDGGANQRSFLFYVSSLNKLGIILSANGTVTAGHALSTTSLASECWYHCAATYNSTTDDLKVYLDGKLETTVTAVGGMMSTSTATFNVGASFNTGSASAWFGGNIQDAAIWIGTELSQAEVQSLASAFPVQQSGIVSYWNLDEKSGTRVDSIGSNDLADNNSVLYGTGKVSNAADFELSNNEYLSITDASQVGLNITSELFIASWLKPESTATFQGIMGKYTGTGNQRSYLLYNNTTTPIFVLSNDGTANTAPAATSTLSNGVWSYLCGNYDGATARIYFNAVQEDSHAWTTGIYDSTADVQIGNYNAGVSPQDGLQDEVIIAKRYFRDEEIKTIYIKGLNGFVVTSDPTYEDLLIGNFFMFFE